MAVELAHTRMYAHTHKPIVAVVAGGTGHRKILLFPHFYNTGHLQGRKGLTENQEAITNSCKFNCPHQHNEYVVFGIELQLEKKPFCGSLYLAK